MPLIRQRKIRAILVFIIILGILDLSLRVALILNKAGIDSAVATAIEIKLIM